MNAIVTVFFFFKYPNYSVTSGETKPVIRNGQCFYFSRLEWHA